MKRTASARNRHDHPFGNGFDFAMQAADHTRFGAWWNRQSFFPVGGDEADAIFSAPEPRRGK